MSIVNRKSLRSGACFALAHAASLIEDAAILYEANRISSGFHLAVLAREELGRANLLWKRASTMSLVGSVTVEDLRKGLQDHIAKLDAGQSTTHFKIPAKTMTEWTAAILANDKAALAKVHEKRMAVAAKVRKHDPARLHNLRFKAQYVDIDTNGKWTKPSETKKADAQSLLVTVACEISDTLLWANEDKIFCDACAKAKQKLPTYNEFEANVMQKIFRVGA
jgi:AbiV family abortive infection protein